MVKVLKYIYWKFRSNDDICFTLWLTFQCLVRGKRAIVLRRVEALGDVICSLPLCAFYQKRYPHCFVVLVTSIFNARIARLSSQSDAVYGTTRSNFTVNRGYLGLVEQSYIVETTDNVSSSGAKSHLIDDLASSCGVKLDERQPRLNVPESLQAKVSKLLEIDPSVPLITINPGPTWPVRIWPVQHWQELINLINDSFRVQMVMIGGPRGGKRSEYDDLYGVKNIAGKLRSDELAVLLSLSRLLISIDSGPIHIAGAVGTPTIGLFGAVDPKLRLGPEAKAIGLTAEVPCLFCHHLSPLGHWQTGCPYDIQCMKDLYPEVVFKNVSDILKTSIIPSDS